MAGLALSAVMFFAIQSPAKDAQPAWIYKRGQSSISSDEPDVRNTTNRWIFGKQAGPKKFDYTWLSAFQIIDRLFPKSTAEKGEFEKREDFYNRERDSIKNALVEFLGTSDLDRYFLLPVPETSFMYDADSGKETVSLTVYGNFVIGGGNLEHDYLTGHIGVEPEPSFEWDVSHVPHSYTMWGDPATPQGVPGPRAELGGWGFSDSYSVPLAIDDARNLKDHLHLALVCRFQNSGGSSLLNRSHRRYWQDVAPFVSVAGDILFDDRSGKIIRERLPKE